MNSVFLLTNIKIFVLYNLIKNPIMNNSPKETILIVEDKKDWQKHIANVIRDMIEKNDISNFNIEFASNATEAIEIIKDTINYKVSLILSDLHMAKEKEKADEDNGDALLLWLMKNRITNIPIAFLSNTSINEYKIKLKERIPEIELLDKSATSPTQKDSADRKILEKNIIALLKKGFNLPNDPEYIEIIREMKGILLNLASLVDFIDEVGGEIGSIWKKHEDFLISFNEKEIRDKVGILKKADIHGDEFNYKKFHDFKGELEYLIDLLKDKYNDPKKYPEALNKLIGLHAYITLVWVNVKKENNDEIDLVSYIESACSHSNSFSKDRINFTKEIDNLKVSVPLVNNSYILKELLTNARVHSSGEIRVHINKEGELIIQNEIEGPLNFSVVNNKIIGEIQSSSPRGTGQGIKTLIETVKALDLNFNLTQKGNTITAKIDYSNAKCLVEEKTKENNENSDILPLGNVVLWDHDRSAKATFESLQEVSEGMKIQNINKFDTDINKFKEILEENKEIFNNASLCVMHIGLNDIDKYFPIIQEKFPNLILLPASGSVDLFRDSISFKILIDRAGDNKRGNILILDDIKPYVDNELFEKIKKCLYEKNYTTEVWNAIVNVAYKMSLLKLNKI